MDVQRVGTGWVSESVLVSVAGEQSSNGSHRSPWKFSGVGSDDACAVAAMEKRIVLIR
jgi:hypothetical protein